jgi:hypothetical protein
MCAPLTGVPAALTGILPCRALKLGIVRALKAALTGWIADVDFIRLELDVDVAVLMKKFVEG